MAGRPRDTKPSAGKPPSVRETARPSPSSGDGFESGPVRERQPTILDEVATEQARLASVLMDSTPPAPPKKASDVRRTVPSATPLVIPRVDTDELVLLRARLAPMSRVPALARKLTELGDLIEDPKTAYVLGFVDGLLPLETIVEVAGLPELDTLRILDRAVEHHVLTFAAGEP